MIQIDVPEVSNLISVEDLLKIPEKLGIYYFYSKDKELLYIGKSNNLRTRIQNHVRGKTNTAEYSNEFKYIRYSLTGTELDTDIYETYLISTMNPKYNIGKRYKNEKENVIILEDEKNIFINFVLKLLSLNKGLSLGRYAIEQICENNKVKFFSYYDKDIYPILIKKGISISPMSLLHK
ncbi:nucleotide excision repair endonuclease [Bacillus sp. UMB0728]|uniref:nucleotide excision repair endonuclease n=1 Tax=Bacillus sp. UMB0728 TaxID=2066052 RepID=UPI0015DDAB3B|nr:nucleotide excision repair endonuclease [Bacillus sp. UMB0728]